MTAALLLPRAVMYVGFGKLGAKRRSGRGQGKVGAVAAASMGSGLALICSHEAPSAPCAPSLGSGSRPALSRTNNLQGEAVLQGLYSL